MVSEAIMGLSALKTAFDIAKGLKDADSAVRINTAVIELQENILSAQQAQAILIEQVRRLETQLASFESWETEKKRYELKELYQGFFAYVPKAGEENGEPLHAICTNCYQRRKRSVLQSNGEMQWTKFAWICPECRTAFKCAGPGMSEMITNARQGTVED